MVGEEADMEHKPDMEEADMKEADMEKADMGEPEMEDELPTPPRPHIDEIPGIRAVCATSIIAHFSSSISRDSLLLVRHIVGRSARQCCRSMALLARVCYFVLINLAMVSSWVVFRTLWRMVGEGNAMSRLP